MKNNNIINKELFYNCTDVCCFIESLPKTITTLQRERLIKLFACYRPTTK